MQPGDRVAILSENRPEWAIADYACLTASLTDVPLYPNLPAEQAAYILRDSGAVAIFVSDAEQAAKIAAVRAQVPDAAPRHHLRRRAARGRRPDARRARGARRRGGRRGAARRVSRARARRAARRPRDAHLHVGHDGRAEGRHAHARQPLLERDGVARCRSRSTAKDVGLSFLPLSHIFERMAGHYLMFHVGCSIAYAESIDTVPIDMQTVRPTLVLSVPRLYEKMYARVLENALSGGAIKKRIFFWARGVAERWADVKLAGGDAARVARAAVRASRRSSCSPSCRRAPAAGCATSCRGGAPLAPEINKFFYAAGLVILEGYGLTETSPVIAVNTPDAFRIGTVGKPIAGVEVTIAADGEILTRGPHVMKGYYNKPEATREAIDAEGWFHTGDIGELRRRLPARSPTARRTSSSPRAARTSRRSRSRTRSRRTSTSARR